MFAKKCLIGLISLVAPLMAIASVNKGVEWFSGSDYKLQPNEYITKRFYALPNTSNGDNYVLSTPSGNLIAYSNYNYAINNTYVKKLYFTSGIIVPNGFNTLSTTLNPSGIFSVTASNGTAENDYWGTSSWKSTIDDGLFSKIEFTNTNESSNFKPQLRKAITLGSTHLWGNVNFNNISKPYFNNREVLLSSGTTLNKNSTKFSSSNRYSITFTSDSLLIVKDSNKVIWSIPLDSNINYIKLNYDQDGLIGYYSDNQKILIPELSGSTDNGAELIVSNSTDFGILYVGKEVISTYKDNWFLGASTTMSRSCNNNPPTSPKNDWFFVSRNASTCYYNQYNL